MPNILIGVPSHRDVNVHTLASLRRLEQPDGYQVMELFMPGAIIWSNRGSIVNEMLKDPETHYLLFCDSDMVAPPHALKTMLSRDADIVASLCCKRVPPYRPVIHNSFAEAQGGAGQKIGWIPMTGVHPIWGSGLAGTLIKRHVFEAILKEFGPHLFWHQEIKLPDGRTDVLGEDVTFFYKANKCGFRTVLDADVHFGHISDWPIYPADARRWVDYDVSVSKAVMDRDGEIARLKKELEEAKREPLDVSI